MHIIAGPWSIRTGSDAEAERIRVPGPSSVHPREALLGAYRPNSHWVLEGLDGQGT